MVSNKPIGRRRNPPPSARAGGASTNAWLVFGMLVLPLGVMASNLPLLSGTLRTFQKHACDGDELVLVCPPNTVISINLAQYGRQVPSFQLCPPETTADTYFLENDTTNCLASEALRTVEATCREQRVCQIQTSPDSFGGHDPCPGVRKYAEVAYKCRPNTFFNKVVCEGDRLHLRCHKSLRIIIYSAAFGGTHYGVPECPQPEGGRGEDCQVSYATETVMSNCHGRRKCSIEADISTFGDPGCPKGTRLFLKVVYTCVPNEILKDLDLGGSEADGKEQGEDSDYTGFVEEPRYFPVTPGYPDLKHKMAAPDVKSTPPYKAQFPGEPPDFNVKTTPKSDMQSDENTEDQLQDANCTVAENDKEVVGFVTEWIAAYNFIKANKEKFILYLTLSLGAGLIAFLVVLSTRLWIQKRRQRKRANLNNENMPSAFGDDNSDIDQFDARGDPREGNIEVVRYNNRSTLRRPASDTHPRAPMSRNMNNYYYS